VSYLRSRLKFTFHSQFSMKCGCKQLRLRPTEPIALFKFCAPVLCEMGARKSAIPQRVLQFPCKHAGTFSGQEKKPFFYPIFANTALDTGMCCAV